MLSATVSINRPPKKRRRLPDSRISHVGRARCLVKEFRRRKSFSVVSACGLWHVALLVVPALPAGVCAFACGGGGEEGWEEGEGCMLRGGFHTGYKDIRECKPLPPAPLSGQK